MLKDNTGLQMLNLENNNIGAEGVEAIANALTVNTTLEHLNLCKSSIKY
jgi:Ran GTPase-activating protein (RanGAP) involved in mRNA processing and transport